MAPVTEDATQSSSGLISYLESVKARDPAARSKWEVLLYQGVIALGFAGYAVWQFFYLYKPAEEGKADTEPKE